MRAIFSIVFPWLEKNNQLVLCTKYFMWILQKSENLEVSVGAECISNTLLIDLGFSKNYCSILLLHPVLQVSG